MTAFCAWMNIIVWLLFSPIMNYEIENTRKTGIVHFKTFWNPLSASSKTVQSVFRPMTVPFKVGNNERVPLKRCSSSFCLSSRLTLITKATTPIFCPYPRSIPPIKKQVELFSESSGLKFYFPFTMFDRG